MDLDGYFVGGHSLFLTPREVARIGQLVLDDGAWDGESLVPSAWLDESLTEVWDLGCPNLQPVREGYGYLRPRSGGARPRGGAEATCMPDARRRPGATRTGSPVWVTDHGSG